MASAPLFSSDFITTAPIFFSPPHHQPSCFYLQSRAFELSIPFVWNALFPEICMANWSHFHSILTKSHRFSETFLEYPVQNIIFSHPPEFTSSSLLYFSTWNITLSNISLIYWSISQLVTWRITETGKSEIKVIVYKDKFRFRCEKFEIKKGYVQVFMSTTKW